MHLEMQHLKILATRKEHFFLKKEIIYVTLYFFKLKVHAQVEHSGDT